MNRRLLRCAILIGAAAFALSTNASPAAASPDEVGVGLALFEGKTIDLRKGWGDAQACVVFTNTRTECFRTSQEANDVVGYGQARVQGPHFCPDNWLCLYEHIDFNHNDGPGRRLQFNEEYWHDLHHWAFERQTSSWVNAQYHQKDHGTLGDGAGGTYPMESGASSARMGSWNDRAIHVHG